MVGEMVEVDVDEESIGWRPYLRVKVAINIHNPLMKGMHLNMARNKVWISFLYERLSSFYFKCDIIKHGEN